MRSPRSRWWSSLLAAGALALALLSRPAVVHADGSAKPPGPTDRVVKIGPQATVIVNEHGDVRMYDDPAESAPACKSTAACWGKALGVFSLFFAATYEDWTDGLEGSSQSIQRLPAEE